jgi:hypothetical protein
MSTMTVAVDKKGVTTLSVKGVQGSSCSLRTKKFSDALGTVLSDEPTAEFYQSPPEKVRVSADATGA